MSSEKITDCIVYSPGPRLLTLRAIPRVSPSESSAALIAGKHTLVAHVAHVDPAIFVAEIARCKLRPSQAPCGATQHSHAALVSTPVPDLAPCRFSRHRIWLLSAIRSRRDSRSAAVRCSARGRARRLPRADPHVTQRASPVMRSLGSSAGGRQTPAYKL